jgi:hypothetical protein
MFGSPYLVVQFQNITRLYNSQNENPLANVGPHSFTLSRTCGVVWVSPHTPSQFASLVML